MESGALPRPDVLRSTGRRAILGWWYRLNTQAAVGVSRTRQDTLTSSNLWMLARESCRAISTTCVATEKIQVIERTRASKDQFQADPMCSNGAGEIFWKRSKRDPPNPTRGNC